SRIPNFKPAVVYDPEFTAGRHGVYVEASGDRIAEARRIMQEQEPIELREGATAHVCARTERPDESGRTGRAAPAAPAGGGRARAARGDGVQAARRRHGDGLRP